jgi:hypothetical protein
MLSTNACDKAPPFLNHFRHQQRQAFEYITRESLAGHQRVAKATAAGEP